MIEKRLLLWKCAPFRELSLEKLYRILALRAEVFVVEQKCNYLDMDGVDPKCLHLTAMDNDGRILAYARIVPAGTTFKQMSIGRIIVASEARSCGLGTELVRRSIEACEEVFDKGPIRIGAQVHLKDFYETFGFQQVSDEYDDHGIPHIEMERP